MSLRTYTWKVKSSNGERTINIKMKKKDLRQVERELNRVLDIRHHRRELTGVVDGENERSYTLWSPFTAAWELSDEAAYEKEKENFLGHLPDPITYDNWPGIRDQIDEIFERHVPVSDQRETPEQHAETLRQREEQRQAEEARRAEQEQAKKTERDRIIKKYAHLTPKGNKSPWATGAENIRRELSRAFPSQKFSVKSESFSMGSSIHIVWEDGPTQAEVEKITDKYQEGKFDGMTDSYDYNHTVFHDIFGGAKYVQTHREISLAVRRQVAESRGFIPDDIMDEYGRFYSFNLEHEINTKIAETSFYQAAAGAAGDPDEPEPAAGVDIRTNPNKDGLEIRFSEKPYAGILAILRENGYRWHKKRKFWYARQNSRTWAAAHDIALRFGVEIQGEETTATA